MSTLNNVVLFVLVLFVLSFGSVGCGSSTPTRTTTTSAPTRPPVEPAESWVSGDVRRFWDETDIGPRNLDAELIPTLLQHKRRAYARLTRAVEAVQSKTGTEQEQIRNLDHAIRHAYRVFYTLFRAAELADVRFHDGLTAAWTSNSGATTRERELNIESRQRGALNGLMLAALLEQPTEVHRSIVEIFRRGGNYALNPGERVIDRLNEAHGEDWDVFFLTLQEGIDALLQAAEVLATMPGADAAFAAPRLRSAIQVAKQQSVRMGEFAIESPIVQWIGDYASFESDAHKAYDEALRELTRAALHVASNLSETSGYEPPPLE